MSMIKIVPPGSWPFEIEQVSLVKWASGGLRGDDLGDFLYKRAADNVLVRAMQKIALQPGDMPLHIIALGATEAYGCNRNGDGFSEPACRKYAATFEGKPLSEYKKGHHNGARIYLNHKNQDPEKSYGFPKLAFYSDRMRRVELFAIGNETKQAAERNGGLVMPHDLIEDLHSGKFPGFSMSCKVAYDVCSVCDNKAPSRNEYCTSHSCVGKSGMRGFGCRDGLTRLLKNGHQQYVDNPEPSFFDISKVRRPADRGAYGGIVEGMGKAASEEIVQGGAWLAEQYGMFGGGMILAAPSTEHYRKQLKLAQELAEVEADVMDRTAHPQAIASKMAFHEAVQTPLDFSALGRPGTTKFAAGMRALAEADVMLTPADFLKIASPGISGEQLEVATTSLRAALPVAFRKLAADEKLARYLDHAFAADPSATPDIEQRRLAAKAAETRSFCPCQLTTRAQLAALRGASEVRPSVGSTKSASEVGHGLARQYALYQLSSLATSPSVGKSMLTLRTVLLQNTN